MCQGQGATETHAPRSMLIFPGEIWQPAQSAMSTRSLPPLQLNTNEDGASNEGSVGGGGGRFLKLLPSCHCIERHCLLPIIALLTDMLEALPEALETLLSRVWGGNAETPLVRHKNVSSSVMSATAGWHPTSTFTSDYQQCGHLRRSIAYDGRGTPGLAIKLPKCRRCQDRLRSSGGSDVIWMSCAQETTHK